MRIALVFPESTFLSSSNVWPPLGLFYLAAQLEAQGHQTDFFDMGLGDKLPNDGEYDQMWISGTSPQMHSIRKIGEHTRNFKHTKTVFGGAAAWANPKSALELPFDLIVSGEADHPETVAQILHRVNEPYKLYSPPMHKDLDWVLPPIRRWNLRYHSYMTDKAGKSYRMASIFTARGCPMSCAFCIAENQKVLMADLTYKYIQDVRIGDMVMGVTQTLNKQRIVSPTLVTNVMNNGIRDTIKITAGTQALECTPDHKIFVDDSWDTRWKRADSTVAGQTRVRLFPTILERSEEFRRGWLAGYIAGDGCVHKRNNKTQITITSRDPEMLDTIQEWGLEFGCKFRRFNHKMGGSVFPTKLNKDYIDAVQCTSGVESDAFLHRVAEMGDLSFEYMEGWLGGMYDSDGTLDSGGDCRIIQSEKIKPHNTRRIAEYLDYLGINYCTWTFAPRVG